jgi:hypothetical protein
MHAAVLGAVVFLGTPVASVSAGAGPVEMTDAELDAIYGGDLDIEVDVDFNNRVMTFVQGNRAHAVGFELGGNAFRNAQGVMTTLMAVNSSVDLNVVVNIYLDRGSRF